VKQPVHYLPLLTSRSCCAAARQTCRSLRAQNLELNELTLCGTEQSFACGRAKVGFAIRLFF
jgi:hypothetical protein